MKNSSEKHKSESGSGFQKRDFILLVVILLIAGAGLLINRLIFTEPAAVVEVAVIDESSDKTILERFDLSKNVTYMIVTEPPAGETEPGENLLIIENGNVCISEANCPNRDCVHKGTIRQNGEMLVCLPHRVTVSIVGE